MPYIKRIQSLVNHADALSTGNKEAGLVNAFEFNRIPRNKLKSKTKTFLLSATNGNKLKECGSCLNASDEKVFCPKC